jgi:AcrR family transcriptional regulator
MDNKEKKEKVFDAIFSAVIETGDFSSITVSDIAKRAGIGKGSVYMYFVNKDQMVYESAKYLIDSTMQNITGYSYNSADNFKTIMVGFLTEHINAMNKYYRIFCAVTNENYFPQLAPALGYKMKGLLEETKVLYHKKLLELILIGAGEGIIEREHSEYVRLCVAQMLFSSAARYAHEDDAYNKTSMDDYIKLMYDMTVKMLK